MYDSSTPIRWTSQDVLWLQTSGPVQVLYVLTRWTLDMFWEMHKQSLHLQLFIMFFKPFQSYFCSMARVIILRKVAISIRSAVAMTWCTQSATMLKEHLHEYQGQGFLLMVQPAAAISSSGTQQPAIHTV